MDSQRPTDLRIASEAPAVLYRESLRVKILFALFIALMVGMNLLGGKITNLFGFAVSVSIFMLPVTFLITDIIAEVYGRTLAQEFVVSGMVALVVMLGFTVLAVALPPHPRYAFERQYEIIFGSSLRIMVASVVAFGLAQIHDVWAFHFLRRKTSGRHLWLRNNVSTVFSQAIDTAVFLTVAFYGATPNYDAGFILNLFIPFYLFKVVFAILDTPFVYLGVGWLRAGFVPPRV